jgi:hypothetical protein
VLAIAALAIVFWWRARNGRAALCALAASFLVTGGALGVIAPGLDAPWIAPRLVAALPRAQAGHLPPLIVSGYSEPSLVFLAGTRTRFVPPERAADELALSSNSHTVAAIATTADAQFHAEMARLNLGVQPVDRISGFNYSIGKPVTLILYKAQLGKVPP